MSDGDEGSSNDKWIEQLLSVMFTWILCVKQSCCNQIINQSIPLFWITDLKTKVCTLCLRPAQREHGKPRASRWAHVWCLGSLVSDLTEWMYVCVQGRGGGVGMGHGEGSNGIKLWLTHRHTNAHNARCMGGSPRCTHIFTAGPTSHGVHRCFKASVEDTITWFTKGTFLDRANVNHCHCWLLKLDH